jgi:hypothetical protein
MCFYIHAGNPWFTQVLQSLLRRDMKPLLTMQIYYFVLGARNETGIYSNIFMSTPTPDHPRSRRLCRMCQVSSNNASGYGDIDFDMAQFEWQ